MKITKRQLRRIIHEAQADVTPKYDDDSALVGDQSKLKDPLQKAIIDKTVEDREEAKEKEAKEKSESIRITKTQLRKIIRETIEAVDVDTGEVWDNEDGSVPDEAWPDLVQRLGIEIERQDPDGTYYIDDVSKLFDEVQGKREDRAAAAKAERLQINNLLARVDQWAEDAATEFLADNPGADMQGVARDLARSIEYEFDDDEWNELTWHFDEEAWEISPQEDGTEMLFTYVADRLAG